MSITSVHRCSECVITDGVCGWCQLDFTCTGDNSTCTGGSDNWLTVSTLQKQLCNFNQSVNYTSLHFKYPLLLN